MNTKHHHKCRRILSKAAMTVVTMLAVFGLASTVLADPVSLTLASAGGIWSSARGSGGDPTFRWRSLALCSHSASRRGWILLSSPAASSDTGSPPIRTARGVHTVPGKPVLQDGKQPPPDPHHTSCRTLGKQKTRHILRSRPALCPQTIRTGTPRQARYSLASPTEYTR